MRKKLLISVLAAGMLAMNVMPAALAEEETETEAAAEETETEAAAEEAETEAAEEDETEEAETEAEPRPTYTALDYVELGDYIGLEVDVNAVTFTEEDVVEEAKALLRDSEDLWESVDVVEDGVVANIDYVGTLDGEAFDGGTAEGYDLEIGSGTFIDGFEDGLIGANAGDTLDLELTFPEDYYSDDLAGQDVIFTVTVNEITRAPELTDENVNALSGGEFPDVESFEDYIRDAMQQQADYYQDYYAQQAILYALEDSATIREFPEDLMLYTLDEFKDIYGDDYLNSYGYTDEESRRELAQEYLTPELVLQAVAENEDMTLTDEEYEAGLENYAGYYGYSSGADFEEAYVALYGEDTLYDSILDDKALTFVVENAVINIVE